MSERISIAEVRKSVATRTRGYPERWGPVCYGCGAPEFRIDGFCSINCRDYHNDEDFEAVAALLGVVEAAHASTGPLSDSLRAALDRFDFGDAQ